jgi:hypothetical protein
MNRDHSFPGKFKSIRLEAQKNLHHSLLIGANYRTSHFSTIIYDLIFISNIMELSKELKLKLCGHLPLNTHYFFHSFSDIKFFDIFPKFAGSDLSVV